MRKFKPVCAYCNETPAYAEFRGLPICIDCRKKLNDDGSFKEDFEIKENNGN